MLTPVIHKFHSPYDDECLYKYKFPVDHQQQPSRLIFRVLPTQNLPRNEIPYICAARSREGLQLSVPPRHFCDGNRLTFRWSEPLPYPNLT